MPKSFNRGGQNRNMLLACGFQIHGTPREADNKARRHIRYCKVCQDMNVTIAPFDKTNASMNGWKGISGHSRVDNVVASATTPDDVPHILELHTRNLDQVKELIGDSTE